MKRKILISFFAVIVFSMPLQLSQLQVANAAVATKVASAAAKQVAKVPIRDITKDIAFEMAMQAVGQSFNEKSTYKFEEGYEGYCMTEIKSDGSCGKVVQIKKDLTTQDMSAIDNQVGPEIDKSITSGAGLTKWQKFLDWFVPIWLVSAAATAITYAIDGDVRDWFNEIGYNTLVSLGFIKEVSTDEAIPTVEVETPANETDSDGIAIPDTNTSQMRVTTATSTGNLSIPNPISATNAGIVSHAWAGMPIKGMDVYGVNINGTDLFTFNADILSMSGNEIVGTPVEVTIVSSEHGTVETIPFVNGAAKMPMKPDTYIGFFQGWTHTVFTRLPFESNGSWYTDVLVKTNEDGTSWHMYQIKHTAWNVSQINAGSVKFSSMSGSTDVTTTIKGDMPNNKVVYPPLYAEQPIESINSSTYTDESGTNMALVPPSALPYTDADTGETLTRTPNSDPTLEPVFTRPDGTVVTDDKVVVGEPVVTKDPSGVPLVTPTPTPENPNPTPVELVPTPGGTEPPVGTDEPPMEPFPEGESCQEKLKFPIFSPLKEQFSTSFPFSIPWDMERAINAAFAEIGNDKPSFTLDLAFMGETKEIVITVPKMFDDWKPFTDTLLLLTFDILIMFGVYRFVKGAGS